MLTGIASPHGVGSGNQRGEGVALLEGLATRKVRAENSEFASGWDAMRLAVRRHAAFLKKQAKDQKQVQTRADGAFLRVSRALNRRQ